MRAIGWPLMLALLGGLGLLYAPMAALVVYSFNASERVLVWGGWSTVWYGRLLDNSAIHEALGRSVLVGAASASLATVFGAAAGYALARFGAFPGRGLFAALGAAPLVVPEVALGLALLLLFVSLDQAIGWPAQRGLVTVILSHASIASAYVAIVVQARLARFDAALEEAAADLGCPPFQGFLRVTLPLIAPGLAAGWLIAFTLSFDDLVIASFTTGPGAGTLPMLAFSKVRLGLSPEINALATLLLLGVLSLGVLAFVLQRRR